MVPYFNIETRQFSYHESFAPLVVNGAIGSLGGAVIGRSINRRQAERKGYKYGSKEYKRMVRRGTGVGAGVGLGLGVAGGFGLLYKNSKLTEKMFKEDGPREKYYKDAYRKAYDDSYQSNYDSELKSYREKYNQRLNEDRQREIDNANEVGEINYKFHKKLKEADIEVAQDKIKKLREAVNNSSNTDISRSVRIAPLAGVYDRVYGIPNYYGETRNELASIGIGGVAGAGLGVLAGRSLMRRNANRMGIERGTDQYKKMMNRGALRGGLIGSGAGALVGGLTYYPIKKNLKNIRVSATERGTEDGKDRSSMHAWRGADETARDEYNKKKNSLEWIRGVEDEVRKKQDYWNDERAKFDSYHEKEMGRLQEEIDSLSNYLESKHR